MGFSIITDGNSSVVYVNTEMPRPLLKKFRKTILSRAGEVNSDRLKIIDLYGMSPAECRERTCEIIAALQAIRGIELIVIDGIAEFVSSTNDETESNDVIRLLEEIGQKTGSVVLGVIHANAATDSKARGHMGSQGTRKGSAILLVTKNKIGVSTVTAKHLRHSSESDFPAIRFRFDDSLKMHVSETAQAVPVAEKLDKQAMVNIMTNVFLEEGKVILKTAEIQKRIAIVGGKLYGREWGTERCKQIKGEAAKLGVIVPAIQGKRGYFKLAENTKA